MYRCFYSLKWLIFSALLRPLSSCNQFCSSSLNVMFQRISRAFILHFLFYCIILFYPCNFNFSKYLSSFLQVLPLFSGSPYNFVAPNDLPVFYLHLIYMPLKFIPRFDDELVVSLANKILSLFRWNWTLTGYPALFTLPEKQLVLYSLLPGAGRGLFKLMTLKGNIQYINMKEKKTKNVN